MVHDLRVVVEVGGRFQVEGAGEVLDVDHVGQGGFGEAQDSEGAAGGGVAAVAEGHDLQADLGQGGGLEQVVQLGAHHLAAAHGSAQRCLVHDRPHPGGSGAVSRSWRFMRRLTRLSICQAGAAWWPSLVTARA